VNSTVTGVAGVVAAVLLAVVGIEGRMLVLLARDLSRLGQRVAKLEGQQQQSRRRRTDPEEDPDDE
jgi:hypothetical protein